MTGGDAVALEVYGSITNLRFDYRPAPTPAVKCPSSKSRRRSRSLGCFYSTITPLSLRRAVVWCPLHNRVVRVHQSTHGHLVTVIYISKYVKFIIN